MQFQDIKSGRFYLGDCLEVMKEIPDGVIDMLLVDLPYGTTNNKWDSVIPFDKLWMQYNRICKENAAMVFTASQPFTTALIASNIDNFGYELIWDKTKGGNFLLAKKQPMKSHENVLIFYRKPPIYKPQMEIRGKPRKKGGGKASDNFGATPSVSHNNEYYPKSIMIYSTGSRVDKFHPTQKPIELFEYLIKTYTNEGDLVLDNTAGSGTTAIAAENTGRKWVCIEQNEEYATKAVERIRNNEIKPKEETREVKIESDIPIPEGGENGN